MAKIAKADYGKIRQLVEEEGRKVPDVAEQYGCTSATIYAILNKLRRTHPAPEPVAAAPASAHAADLFQAAPSAPPASAPPVSAPVATPAAANSSVTPFVRRETAKGVGGKLAKPGFGLTMRTSDGEEQISPFRSLEDLLSAIKPILRSAARNPEPAWFSVAPLDLASIETDAA